jgi:hypothetical protein
VRNSNETNFNKVFILIDDSDECYSFNTTAKFSFFLVHSLWPHAETVPLDMDAIFISALYVDQYEELTESEASAAANRRTRRRILVRQ